MDNQDMWKFNDMKRNEIEDVLNDNETVLYRAKPKKSAYIWSAVLRMLPIAIIWLTFDGISLVMTLVNGIEMPTGGVILIILFVILHLLPVWIWLGGIIKASLEFKNIDYAITDKRIIIRNGIIGIDFKIINFNEIDSVEARVGVLDRMFHVGDIYIKHGYRTSVMWDVPHPYEVLNNLQKITLDIKADIHYPNDLRPSTNHGYNTKYESNWKEIKK